MSSFLNSRSIPVFAIFMRQMFYESLNFLNFNKFLKLEQEYSCIPLAKGSIQVESTLPERKQKMDLE